MTDREACRRMLMRWADENSYSLDDAIEDLRVVLADTTLSARVPAESELKFPPGYCLDPNGRMIAPEGKGEDFDFGYEVGYREAFGTLKRAALSASASAVPVAPSIFARMEDGRMAEVAAESALEEILGVDLLGIGFDDYDSSFEIYPMPEVQDVIVSEEQHAKIMALGCSRYWINFPDDTERYGRGERHPGHKGSWERFNSGATPTGVDEGPEIRRNADGSLDEVVARGDFHLEQMSATHWWMAINYDGERRICVNLQSKATIKAFAEDEGGRALSSTRGE